MTLRVFRIRGLRVAAAFCALACFVLALLLVLPSRASRATVSLISPAQLPSHRRPLFARFIPVTPRWAWAWRLKEKILGRPRPVDLDAVVLRFADLPSATGTNLVPSPPSVTGSNGLQAWPLSAAEIAALRNHLKQSPGAEFLFPCRASTASGVDVSMYHGTSVPINGAPASVGLFLDFFPRVRSGVIELTTSLTFTEGITNRTLVPGQSAPVETISLQTNLAVAARFQLTNGSGVFLFQPAGGNTNNRAVGLLLSATLPAKK